MVSSRCRAYAIVALSLAVLWPAQSPAATRFSFTIDSAATTSAGVFMSDGTLVKTLWSGSPSTPGPYTGSWDGTDDDGRIAPDGSYQVRVLSNNVQYAWEGVVGNTSDALSGPTVHHALEFIYGMAISGANAYFCVGYNEALASTHKFRTASPHPKPRSSARGRRYSTWPPTGIMSIGPARPQRREEVVRVRNESRR